MKCNQSRPGFELVSPCPFPTAITTTPRVPLQWRGSPHSTKPLHYWSCTNNLFSIISGTLVGGVLPLCRDAVGVFCNLSRRGLLCLKSNLSFVIRWLWYNIVYFQNIAGSLVAVDKKIKQCWLLHFNVVWIKIKNTMFPHFFKIPILPLHYDFKLFIRPFIFYTINVIYWLRWRLSTVEELRRFNAVARYHQQSGFTGKRKMKEGGEKCNLLPVDRVTDISVRRSDQQITGKKRKYVIYNNQP